MKLLRRMGGAGWTKPGILRSRPFFLTRSLKGGGPKSAVALVLIDQGKRRSPWRAGGRRLGSSTAQYRRRLITLGKKSCFSTCSPDFGKKSTHHQPWKKAGGWPGHLSFTICSGPPEGLGKGRRASQILYKTTLSADLRFSVTALWLSFTGFSFCGHLEPTAAKQGTSWNWLERPFGGMLRRGPAFLVQAKNPSYGDSRKKSLARFLSVLRVLDKIPLCNATTGIQDETTKNFPLASKK